MKYGTMQIFDITEIEEFNTLKSFHGIKFSLRDDPSELHYCNLEGGKQTIHLFYPRDNNYEIDFPAKELIIEGCSQDEAYNISKMVQTGCLLGYPSLGDYPEPRYPAPYDYVEEVKKLPIESQSRHFNSNYAKEPIRSNLVLGCQVAKKSYNDLTLLYCLEKYRFSLELDSVSPHSVHPKYGYLFESDTNDYSYHVRSSYSFLAAYSIIEELKVDIRSNSKKPRWQEGEWNPLVREDVMNRLKDIDVDGEDIITFSIRGSEQALTRKVKEKLGVDSEYQRYEDVHDIDLLIIDAIHYLSYIRNFFLAHKLSEQVRNISVYDVNNAQMLARYLLMNRLGIWKVPKRIVKKDL